MVDTNPSTDVQVNAWVVDAWAVASIQEAKAAAMTDLDSFAEWFDPNKQTAATEQQALSPEQQAAIQEWKDAIAVGTTVMDETLKSQIEQWKTYKELLEGKSAVEQMKILQQLWLLNEDVILPDPNKDAARDALSQAPDWNIDWVTDQWQVQEPKKVDLTELKDLLEKSKKGSIFDNSNDGGAADNGDQQQAADQDNGEELNVLKAQVGELQEKVTSLSEKENARMQEKQQLMQSQEELNFDLRKEKWLREKFEKMASDYQTDTDLVKIGDPFVRQLNEKISSHKQEPSREWALEILYKMNDVIKNVTGGLDITNVIKEYDSVTTWAQETKPVNQYNYSAAKDMATRKPQEENKNAWIVPQGVTGRSV